MHRLSRAHAATHRTCAPQIAPIVPVTRRDPFDDPAWLFEPKYDGFRGLVYATRNACIIRSKRGYDFKRFDELCHRVRREIRARDAILDGEVLAIDPSGFPNFRGLLAGGGAMAYVASTCSGSMGGTCAACRW